MNMNIILIGFMGVGKGRIARALAQKTGAFAIDTDDLIESLVKKKIRKIFAEEGEPFFRQLEQRTADWIRENVQSTIISTGGGFFQVNGMKTLGVVVYLHSNVEEIIKAIEAHKNAARKIKKRPLLQDLDKARELFAARLPLYREAADIEINVEGKAPEQVAEELFALLAS
ncbi:MAG: shikimate kinase [Desulfobulbus propionicus]|nr:MAG: shikimate kinase [Desulfobulbus propionicus]PIE66509.1 MAG: shikimate kinase [Desulfobacterales bacterium]